MAQNFDSTSNFTLMRMWRCVKRKFIVDAKRVKVRNDTKLQKLLTIYLYADVAELVDALASGASVRKYVEVQVLFAAPMKYPWSERA